MVAASLSKPRRGPRTRSTWVPSVKSRTRLATRARCELAAGLFSGGGWTPAPSPGGEAARPQGGGHSWQLDALTLPKDVGLLNIFFIPAFDGACTWLYLC